ncbi:DUF417 family protein [Litorilituus lipolyticus]|nr:DUF417 family protein [Litorilituus lipolyticus]
MKQYFSHLILIIIALSTSSLAVSMVLMGHHSHIALITDFYGISQHIPQYVSNLIAVIAFALAACLAFMALKQHKHREKLGYLLIIMAVIPLMSLLGHSMWIASLGGFPAIGSGQGIIKYAALLTIGILFTYPRLSLHTKKWLSLMPVMLVLLWIGGMKFTLLEAKGIEDLVASSPFMSWMYTFWDVQTTSNIIGVYDLFVVALLIAAIYNKRLVNIAIAMSGIVFVMTQSFFFSWDAATSAETLLTTGGHFLIKDLWFIVNLIMFWQLSQHAPNTAQQH